MPYSGDPSDSELDWVRFTIQDVDTVDPIFSDVEVQSYINEQTSQPPGRKYLAAADLLGVLLTKWGGKGGGLKKKQVSRLMLEFGTDEDAKESLQKQMDQLRARGSQLISAKPVIFRSVRGPGSYLR